MMDDLYNYLMARPGITHGTFKWYDLARYHAFVRGYPFEETIDVHILAEDMTMSGNRDAIIDMTQNYDGYDMLIDGDNLAANDKYLTDGGTGIEMTFLRAESLDNYPDEDNYLSPDEYDDDAPFLNYEAFKAAVLENLTARGEEFVLLPRDYTTGYYIVFKNAETGQEYGEYYISYSSPDIVEGDTLTHEDLEAYRDALADAYHLDPADIITATEYREYRY